MSIKLRIFRALLAQCAALKVDKTLRRVELRNSVMFTESVRPAMHITPGDEQRIDEDTRGYTLSLEIRLKVIFSTPEDAYEQCAQLVAAIQACVEGNLQIVEESTGQVLADQLTYAGEYPFIGSETAPEHGTILVYTCQYRRARSAPHTTY